MDNKIIFELIKKDIDELKLIVEALENSQVPQPFLIDIAMSKTQNLSQEISLLRSNERTTQLSVEPEPEIELQATIAEPPREENDDTDIIDEPYNLGAQSETEIEPEIIQAIKIEHDQPSESKVAENNFPLDQTKEHPEDVEVATPGPLSPKEDMVEEQTNLEATMVEKEVVVEEKIGPTPAAPENKNEKSHKVLGEKFTKEPSLNERFTSNSENQYKIKGRPVTNIKGAIGLNDRFMYTRELFENDITKFEITVETLDKAAGLVEAIEYLEQNFQWQKNDTSLKFMELVKRRFEN